MTGWDKEYLYNKADYRQLLEDIMTHEQEVNVEFLEKKIAEITRRKYAIAVGSGTDALYFALMGIKPGDEVLVTDFSWISSASCVSMHGATPVFCDVDLNTYHMSLDSIKRMTTDKTKAIVYPHLFGSMSETRHIRKYCADNNIAFIEDAAQALGASYNEETDSDPAHEPRVYAGSLGEVSTLSFNANKVVAGIAGGGAVLTDNKEQAKMFEKLRKHGKGNDHEMLGKNSKMLYSNAKIIEYRLSKMEDYRKRRTEIAKKYDRNLVGLPVYLQEGGASLINNYHKYTIRVDNKELRDTLKQRLGASVHYDKPLSENSMYENLIHRKDKCINSKKISDTILSLPMHPYLTDDEIEKVCKIIMVTV